MSDQIQLTIGSQPWRPSNDSEIVEEYAHYDMPTSGVLSQSGCFFLFECYEGIAEDFNVWIYAPIVEREEDQLSRLSSDELLVAMDKVWVSRDVTVAVAADDAILTGGTVSVHRIAEMGLSIAVVERLRSLLDREKTISGALDGAIS